MLPEWLKKIFRGTREEVKQVEAQVEQKAEEVAKQAVATAADAVTASFAVVASTRSLPYSIIWELGPNI